jgi:hypothetical protein
VAVVTIATSQRKHSPRAAQRPRPQQGSLVPGKYRCTSGETVEGQFWLLTGFVGKPVEPFFGFTGFLVKPYGFHGEPVRVFR